MFLVERPSLKPVGQWENSKSWSLAIQVHPLIIKLILGIGKSSLIQAILQSSPDIVHYDPPQPAKSPMSSSSSFISRRSTISSMDTNVIPPTDNILEIK